jgi:hypothetical protein
MTAKRMRDAALVADPHQAGFGLEENVAVGHNLPFAPLRRLFLSTAENGQCEVLVVGE